MARFVYIQVVLTAFFAIFLFLVSKIAHLLPEDSQLGTSILAAIVLGIGIFVLLVLIKFRWHLSFLTSLDGIQQKNVNAVTQGVAELCVFIVHGRDDKLLLELKDILQNSFGQQEPVVLRSQPELGMTLIEKFEHYLAGCDCALVLMTPDDIGGLRENQPRERARQNVIFEFGYFVGRLGRKRVILLRNSSDIELPSDILGLGHIDVSLGVSATVDKLRRELEAVARLPRRTVKE